MTTIATHAALSLQVQEHGHVRRRSHSLTAVALSLVLLASAASGAQGIDGVVLIDQELALAGNVTPGDAPGFPVWITQPGSYRLSGNLRLDVPNINLITVFADNVTLDLNGFTMEGPFDQCAKRFVPSWCSAASLGGSGVLSALSRTNITVFNGVVRAMASAGVWLPGANSRIDRLTVTHNGGEAGILVGPGALVSNSIVTHNKGQGIARTADAPLGRGTALAVGNVVQSNAKEGLYFVVARDNVLWGNNHGGPQLIAVSDAGGNVCDIFSC